MFDRSSLHSQLSHITSNSVRFGERHPLPSITFAVADIYVVGISDTPYSRDLVALMGVFASGSVAVMSDIPAMLTLFSGFRQPLQQGRRKLGITES